MEKQTIQEYLQFLLFLEQNSVTLQEKNHICCMEIDHAIRNADLDEFILIVDSYSANVRAKKQVVSSDMEWARNIADAMKKEKQVGQPLFISDIQSFDDFRDKYVKSGMMLRRIEMGYAGDEIENAFSYVFEKKISAYSIASILYSPISVIGHRQEILLKISSWYLEKENSIYYLYKL